AIELHRASSGRLNRTALVLDGAPIQLYRASPKCPDGAPHVIEGVVIQQQGAAVRGLQRSGVGRCVAGGYLQGIVGVVGVDCSFVVYRSRVDFAGPLDRLLIGKAEVSINVVQRVTRVGQGDRTRAHQSGVAGQLEGRIVAVPFERNRTGIVDGTDQVGGAVVHDGESPGVGQGSRCTPVQGGAISTDRLNHAAMARIGGQRPALD